MYLLAGAFGNVTYNLKTSMKKLKGSILRKHLVLVHGLYGLDLKCPLFLYKRVFLWLLSLFLNLYSQWQPGEALCVVNPGKGVIWSCLFKLAKSLAVAVWAMQLESRNVFRSKYEVQGNYTAVEHWRCCLHTCFVKNFVTLQVLFIFIEEFLCQCLLH